MRLLHVKKSFHKVTILTYTYIMIQHHSNNDLVAFFASTLKVFSRLSIWTSRQLTLSQLLSLPSSFSTMTSLLLPLLMWQSSSSTNLFILPLFRICISEKKMIKKIVCQQLNGIVSGGHVYKGRISNCSSDGSSSISSGSFGNNFDGFEMIFFWTDRLRIQPNAEELLRASTRDSGNEGLWALSSNLLFFFIVFVMFPLLFIVYLKFLFNSLQFFSVFFF